MIVLPDPTNGSKTMPPIALLFLMYAATRSGEPSRLQPERVVGPKLPVVDVVAAARRRAVRDDRGERIPVGLARADEADLELTKLMNGAQAEAAGDVGPVVAEGRLTDAP